MEDDPLLHPNSLAAMPLHEITRQHSARGLEERFQLEIDGLGLSQEDFDEVQFALRLALTLHAEDNRGQHPYSTHLLRVATRIITHFEVKDKDIIIAALLHDAVEDHARALSAFRYSQDSTGSARTQELAVEVLSDLFNTRIASIVQAVTNPPFDERGDKNEHYRIHVVESMAANTDARIVKLSDFVDNYVGLIHNEDPIKARRLAGKYGPLSQSMRWYIVQDDTPLNDRVKQRLLDQLDRADEYATSLLEAA